MTAYIEKTKLPNLNPKPGHFIVGVSSSGMHSNGHTGARHVLFTSNVEYREEWKPQYNGRFTFNDKPDILEGKTVLESLLTPTPLYLPEAIQIGKEIDHPDIYGINITGNGLHNFNRIGNHISFEITDPIEPLPIHKLLVQESKWTPQQAYTKQNMGLGFAYITPNQEIAEQITKLINSLGNNKAKINGTVTENKDKTPKTVLQKPYEGKPLTFRGY